MPCTNEMPVLVVMFLNCSSATTGGGGGLPDPDPPPPPPQPAAAPARTASAAARHAVPARAVMSLRAIAEPEADLKRLAPLVGRDRATVERLRLDGLVGEVRPVDLAVP